MGFDQKKYTNEFNRNNYKNYSFRFHKEKEKDIIEFLDNIHDKKKFFKELVVNAKNNKEKK